MGKTTFFKGFSILFIILQTACISSIKDKETILIEVENVKNTFAPDKRTALFNIEVLKGPSSFTLAGESNLPVAVDSLKSALDEKGIQFDDKIVLLPASELEGKIQGVINVSVANLRSEPKHSAELATQATLGTPVKVLKKEGSWYLIQTPDLYLSWVDAGGLQLMTEQKFSTWKKTDKIIYTKTYGHAFQTTEGTNRVSDLVAGDILQFLGTDGDYHKVQFPDGRIAFVATEESQDYQTWTDALTTDADALITTSKTLMGVPYLWGGTSTKGVDCSGFTKTIYFLNGMVIPRDASQQIHTGKAVDSVANFENLEKGDLLFFGRKATDSSEEKVVHVGMWIGDNQFIHSSNMVRISSVDPSDSSYDEYNVNRYLRTKRILQQEEEGLISLKQADLFKD
ncbi:NlpC/P60 family protein [Maribacter sp. X9]|uniref:NlpC/P60 family protein n=1 Tax=Maribacter sp. X9 TaxID=3402159 RepID=UPI003AF3A9EF